MPRQFEDNGMSHVHRNGKNGNLERTRSGYLDKMVNLYDLNIGAAATGQLADKTHRHVSSLTRSRSDAARIRPFCDPIKRKIVPEFCGSISNRKSTEALMKTLIAQEMSADSSSMPDQPCLVAKLMGLDNLPRQVLDSPVRTQSRVNCADRPMSYFEKQQKSPHKGRYGEIIDSERMALVRQKFIEAKLLSMDKKLLRSKKYQDALEVLNSNKDLFLECLQEPNLMSQHPSPEAKRITVLRPSKMLDVNDIAAAGNAIGNRGGVQSGKSSPANFKCCESIIQPTRIVLLKPNLGEPHIIKAASHQSGAERIRRTDVSYGDVVENGEDRHLRDLNIIRRQMPENSGMCSGDETFISSILPNGYVGDESSFHKSEVDCTGDEASDSEPLSPVSLTSWDYGNRLGSAHSSSFSGTSYSPDSSVCREAKKRLSERWTVTASGVIRQERSSTTLGEMLALPEAKKASQVPKNKNVDNSPRNRARSKSLLVSSTESASDNSSFRGKVSSLFSRNKRTVTDSSLAPDTKNEVQIFSGEIWDNRTGINDRRCNCSSPTMQGQLNKASSFSLDGKQGMSFPKSGLTSVATSGNPGENQEQPSPISVFDPPFEEDDHIQNVFPQYTEPNQHGLDSPLSSVGLNVIDKAPHIGSIARTLSWDDDSCENTVVPSQHAKGTLTTQGLNDEEQDLFLFVKRLLSVAGLHGEVQSNSILASWERLGNPLDLMLRDKYIDFEKKQDQLIQKLFVDCVNAALVDISRCWSYSRQRAIPCINVKGSVTECGSSMLVDEVWSRVRAMIAGEMRSMKDDFEGDISLVVRGDVVSEGWIQFLALEMDNIGNEMEEELLQELLEEAVVEMKGRVC